MEVDHGGYADARRRRYPDQPVPPLPQQPQHRVQATHRPLDSGSQDWLPAADRSRGQPQGSPGRVGAAAGGDCMSEFYHHIIFTPPGQIPQHKGPWTDPEDVVKFLEEMKPHYDTATVYMIVQSWSESEITVQDADEWVHMRQVMIECAEEEEKYIEAGVCSQCGACNLAEAHMKCRPSCVGDSGDYSCDGARLWEGERSKEDEEDLS